MKIKFSELLYDLKKKEIKDGEKHVSLKEICVNAMLTMIPQENLDGPTKYNFWKIAKLIEESAEEAIEITAEDITKIKDRVGKIYFPTIVGAVYEALENQKA